MLNFLVGLQCSMTGLQSRMIGALRREEGQGMTEYAMLIAFIAVVAVVAVKFLGSQISTLLNSVASSL